MFSRIVVPLDGTPFGEHALPLALTLARRSGATVHLVTVLPPPATVVGETPFYINVGVEAEQRDQTRNAHQAYLTETKRRCQARGEVAIETEVLDGDVVEAITEYATKSQADLLVCATHGRSPLARFWLGSVSDELTRSATMPLLLVHADGEAADLTAEAPLRRMVVALDGSELAERILPMAAELARVSGATLHLVRVIKPALPVSAPIFDAPVATEGHALLDRLQAEQAEVQREAARYLDQHAERLRQQELTVETRVDVAESPSSALLEEAQEADVVALESHGRGGLMRLILGSVADQVVRGGAAAVLVEHPTA